jgi:hypothetical protein
MSVAPNKLGFVLIFEAKCCILKGLKLVKKDIFSHLKGNIAMLVLYVKRLLNIFRTTIAM